MINYSFRFQNAHSVVGSNNFTPFFNLTNAMFGTLKYMKCRFSFFDSTDSRDLRGMVTLRPASGPLGEIAQNLQLPTGTVVANSGYPFCTTETDFVFDHMLVLGSQYYAMDCTYSFPVGYAIPLTGIVTVAIYMAIDNSLPKA